MLPEARVLLLYVSRVCVLWRMGIGQVAAE